MTEPNILYMGVDNAWIRDIQLIVGATYQYKFLSEDGSFVVDGTPNGTVLSVDVSASDTASWRTGQFQWTLIETFGTAKKRLCDGYAQVLPSAESLGFSDVLTHAERTLKIIEAKIEGRLSSDYERYSIDGRSLDRIPVMDLVSLKKKYSVLARRERIKKGLAKPFKRVKYI